MMKICVLSSGSKGNCSYVETEKHKILALSVGAIHESPEKPPLDVVQKGDS